MRNDVRRAERGTLPTRYAMLLASPLPMLSIGSCCTTNLQEFSLLQPLEKINVTNER